MMLEYLASHPIFNVLSAKEIDTLTTICTLQNYTKGDIIFSEKQPSKRFFILKKGKIKLDFGSEKTIEVSQGQVFGDWAMFNDTVRLATCTAVLEAECIAVDYVVLKDHFKFPSDIALKVVLALSKPIIGRLQTTAQTASEILISQGEGQQVEFKATLRTNKFTNKKDEKIEFASIKTVAGFLNSKGGVLFIGVSDDGSIEGLEADNFENTDKLLLHFGHVIRNKLRSGSSAYIKATPLIIEDKLILRVDCIPSPEPVFLDDKSHQYFYVRQGSETLSYNIEESVNYIHSHF